MYRVLHLMPGADAGGISTVVLNYYRFIDRSRIRFDVAITSDRDGKNGQLLRELGATIYRLPMKSKGIKVYGEALTKLLKDNRYDAIHVHENETSYVALRIAKKAGVKCRIAHAHTSAPFESLKTEIKRLSGCLMNYHYATCVIGCGELAGRRVFGKWNMKRKKAVVLPNAIDTDRFGFDEARRAQMRQELGVEEKLVIGMVGRLSPEKNHRFALQIMKILHQTVPEARLVVVGNGDTEEDVRGLILQYGLEDCVTMLGRRTDVDSLCQAFDVQILPSIHEGFPVAAVEAMASGLPVLLSDSITKELAFGSAVQYLSINDVNLWVDTIQSFRNDQQRAQRIVEVREHGLDIRNTAKTLEWIYLGGNDK